MKGDLPREIRWTELNREGDLPIEEESPKGPGDHLRVGKGKGGIIVTPYREYRWSLSRVEKKKSSVPENPRFAKSSGKRSKQLPPKSQVGREAQPPGKGWRNRLVKRLTPLSPGPVTGPNNWLHIVQDRVSGTARGRVLGYKKVLGHLKKAKVQKRGVGAKEKNTRSLCGVKLKHARVKGLLVSDKKSHGEGTQGGSTGPGIKKLNFNSE